MRNTAARSYAWLAGALILATAGSAYAWTAALPACRNAGSARAFRDDIVDNLVVTGGTAAQVAAAIQECLIAQSEETDKANLGACTIRPKTFVNFMRRARATGLGLVADPRANPVLTMSNTQYYAKYGPAGSTTTVPVERDQLAIPACLQDATLFTNLQAVNLSATPPGTNTMAAQAANGVQTVFNRVAALCGADNVIVVPYITAMTPGIDDLPGGNGDRHGRIIVAYTDMAAQVDARISSYVQFTVNANVDSQTPMPSAPDDFRRKQASIVNVMPTGGAHVFDWKRNNNNSTFAYDANFGNDQKCSQCHVSGFLEIHPFSPADVDVGEVLPTVTPAAGTDPTGWINALNAAWAPSVNAMNQRARSEYTRTAQTRQSTTLHALRADTMTMPALQNFPVMFSVTQGGAVFNNNVACTAPHGRVRTAAGGGSECSVCHGTRGAMITDPFEDGDGVNFLLAKFVEGGFMYPLAGTYTAAWAQPVHPTANAGQAFAAGLARGQVVGNGGLHADRLSLSECLQARAKAEVTAWLKINVAGCN